jgi:Domain of unknown function (DUF4249)
MNIKHLRIFIFIFFVINIVGCIESYDISLNQKNSVLVVEGFLTDDILNPDTIKIQNSNYSNELTSITPIASVKASIVVEGTGNEIPLIEQKTGGFLPPKDFKIKASEKYLLRFSLPNGQKYESSSEQVTITPPILKVYDKFNSQSRLSADGKKILSANEVFLDFQDAPNQKNYYLWRYTHYEKLLHCITCQNSQYDSRTGGCTIKLPSFIRIPYYDYQCAGECYSIFKGNQVNVMSDVVADGRIITGRLIAKLPFYYMAGCLIDIQQMSISPQAYTFYKTLEAQTQTNGGLADTPAAAIVGNIYNQTNPSEKVVGYFSVVSVQKKRYWIDRKDAKGDYEQILNHGVFEEPVNPADPSRPPKAPCIKSPTRTPVRPESWQF